MTLDGLRRICRALPGAAGISSRRTSSASRAPLRPSRSSRSAKGSSRRHILRGAMWVQESELGQALERSELAQLLRSAYDLVVAKPPKSKRPDAARAKTEKKRADVQKRAGARRTVPRRRALSKRR